jgi:AraC-like DNA-binding protein/quercetin dioxygenase-like cupin family protein
MAKNRHSALDEPYFVVRTAAADFPSGFAIDRHAHTWSQLIYAASGVMTVWTEEGSWVAPPHWAIWAPAGVAHAIRFSGPSAMRTIYIRPAEAGVLMPRCSVVVVSPLLRELILRAVGIGILDERTPSHRAIASLIVDEIRDRPTPALGLPMPSSPRTKAAAEQLLVDTRSSVSVARLAGSVGLSARTLERRFLAETGVTLGRWRRHAVLTEALRQLASGQPVKIVAARVGYATPSAFISAFRAAFGTTPMRYFCACQPSQVGWRDPLLPNAE